jgi:hypothetical protein
MPTPYEIINIGALPNDGQGDPLRTAFQKINNNFANIYSTGWLKTEAVTTGNTAQEIFSWPANLMTECNIQINSVQSNSNVSMNIMLSGVVNVDEDDVKWTGYNTKFFGNAITGYDMAVDSGNVIVYANPLITGEINHFITYQIIYNDLLGGIPLVTESGNNFIGTESDNILSTEQAE